MTSITVTSLPCSRRPLDLRFTPLEARMAKRKATRRKKTPAGSRGLSAEQVSSGATDDELAAQVVADGGAVIGSYRNPLGGTLLLLVALPIDRVGPTPYQR